MNMPFVCFFLLFWENKRLRTPLLYLMQRRHRTSNSSLHPRPSCGRHSAPRSSCIIFIVIGADSCSAYFAVKLTYAEYDTNSPRSAVQYALLCLRRLEPAWRSPHEYISNGRGRIFQMTSSQGLVFVVPLQRKLQNWGNAACAA